MRVNTKETKSEVDIRRGFYRKVFLPVNFLIVSFVKGRGCWIRKLGERENHFSTLKRTF